MTETTPEAREARADRQRHQVLHLIDAMLGQELYTRGICGRALRTLRHQIEQPGDTVEAVLSSAALSPPAISEAVEAEREGLQRLAELRSLGWQVAVHNDYRLNGEPHTFWLFTHSNGQWAKGEGRSDAAALREARSAIRAHTSISEVVG